MGAHNCVNEHPHELHGEKPNIIVDFNFPNPSLMMRRGCRAILVGVQTQSVSDAEMLRSLAELRRLAETLGHAVDEHPVTQRRAAMGPRVLGKGKLEELARAREKSLPEEEVALLVDTDRLSRTQERGLAEATRATAVMDRSRIILAIFKQHAQTRAAKLQVEMAQLMYDGPTGVRSTDIGGGGKVRTKKKTGFFFFFLNFQNFDDLTKQTNEGGWRISVGTFCEAN